MIDLKISDAATGEVLQIINGVDPMMAKPMAIDYAVMDGVAVEAIDTQTQEVIFTTG